MPRLQYNRLLEAVQVLVKRRGITKKASTDLGKVLEYPHPERELAFLNWALNADLYSEPVDSRSKETKVQNHVAI